jgi:hypothetical protein
MKTKDGFFTEYVFFKDNRNDQRYVLTIKQIKEKYLDFLKTKEKSWIEYYGHQTVEAFIADKSGLSSVADDLAYYTSLKELLMPLRHEFVKTLSVS